MTCQPLLVYSSFYICRIYISKNKNK
ncbi:hypothetical protein OIU78_003541 [Salix suchowensis]|nr:hypothetical protein OIU78_003541 [Salix suchowensis]